MIQTDRRFHEAVANKVGELEKRTDAQVVVVAAKRSGTYRDIAHTVGGAVALVSLGGLVLLPWTVHGALVVLDLALVWVVIAWGMSESRITAQLANHERRQAQVRAAAAAEFHLEAVHATPMRTGLLVYLSTWEDLIELVPDVGLEARIPRNIWGDVMYKLSTRNLDDFLNSLDIIGEILATHVPATEAPAVALDDAPRIR